MSTVTPPTIRREEPRELPQCQPLNEPAWQAWLAKGRAQEERSYWNRVKAAKMLSLVAVAFAVSAGIFSWLAPYDTAIRFGVAAGAAALMVHQLHMRRYAYASAFAALVVLYNPIAPLLNFADDWGRGLAALSGVAFLAMPARARKEVITHA